MINLMLPLILISSAADVPSAAINTEINTEFCSFKGDDKNPSFLYNKGGQSVEILCTNETCHCDGSKTGYEDCQKCCCSIRERFEASELVETNEVKSSENNNESKTYLIWRIMATVFCVLEAVIGIGAWLYQKRKCDSYRKEAKNLRGSLQDLAGHNNSGLTIVPIPNGLPNNGGENTTVLETQRTVFPVVEQVPSETNPRIDQPSINGIQAVQDEINTIQDTTSSVISTPNSLSDSQNVPSSIGNIEADVEDEREDENAPLTS